MSKKDDLKDTVPSKKEEKEIEKAFEAKDAKYHRDDVMTVKYGKVVEAKEVKGKQETMKIVAVHDEKGVIQNVKTARGDIYSVDQIQTFIRAGLNVVIDFNGNEVAVDSTGIGIECREPGTTQSLFGTLQAFVP